MRGLLSRGVATVVARWRWVLRCCCYLISESARLKLLNAKCRTHRDSSRARDALELELEGRERLQIQKKKKGSLYTFLFLTYAY